MEYLTTEEAAAVIGITPRAVRYAKDHIGHVRLGVVLGFLPADVDRYRRERKPTRRIAPKFQPELHEGVVDAEPAQDCG